MSDPATPRLSPGELPSVRNTPAYGHLKAAFGQLILASTDFEIAGHEQHAAMTDQLLETLQLMMKQVTR
mgnify:CR=1 FL=1